MDFLDFNLDSRLLQAVKKVGFETPTPIQQRAIPVAIAGRDLVGIAQTGTGKTAAFLLPIIQRLIRGPRRRVRALILAPTRELAEQIHQMACTFVGNTGIRSAVIYGGVSKIPQIKALRRGSEIVVACPGRLLDLLRERMINLSQVEVLVLDEVDRMFDMGFLDDVRQIISAVPKHRQNLFFSATMPQEIRTLADQTLHNAESIQISMIAPAKTVSHAIYQVPTHRKKDLLYSLLDSIPAPRILIFTRTKHRAKSLAQSLDKKGYLVAELQGNMSQNARRSSIDGFRRRKYDVLVATDIASRGIDISEISHVINFDIPDTVDAYIHRIGRTGRVDRAGEALSLAGDEDASKLRQIEKCINKPLQRRSLEGFNYGSFDPTKRFERTNRNSGPRSPQRHRKQMVGAR